MSGHKPLIDQRRICKAEKPQRELVPAEFVRPPLVHLIEKEHPDWKPEGFVCAVLLLGDRGEIPQRKAPRELCSRLALPFHLRRAAHL